LIGYHDFVEEGVLSPMKRQKRDPSQRAYIKGYQLGFDGRSEDTCPHQSNSIFAHEWMKGWREGREDQTEGFKMQASQQKILAQSNL
jgi:ribosome modulation factor